MAASSYVLSVAKRQRAPPSIGLDPLPFLFLLHGITPHPQYFRELMMEPFSRVVVSFSFSFPPPLLTSPPLLPFLSSRSWKKTGGPRIDGISGDLLPFSSLRMMNVALHRLSPLGTEIGTCYFFLLRPPWWMVPPFPPPFPFPPLWQRAHHPLLRRPSLVHVLMRYAFLFGTGDTSGIGIPPTPFPLFFPFFFLAFANRIRSAFFFFKQESSSFGPRFVLETFFFSLSFSSLFPAKLWPVKFFPFPPPVPFTLAEYGFVGPNSKNGFPLSPPPSSPDPIRKPSAFSFFLPLSHVEPRREPMKSLPHRQLMKQIEVVFFLPFPPFNSRTVTPLVPSSTPQHQGQKNRFPFFWEGQEGSHPPLPMGEMVELGLTMTPPLFQKALFSPLLLRTLGSC